MEIANSSETVSGGRMDDDERKGLLETPSNDIQRLEVENAKLKKIMSEFVEKISGYVNIPFEDLRVRDQRVIYEAAMALVNRNMS